MTVNRILLIGALVLAIALTAACQPITPEDMQRALAGEPGALVPTPRPAATEKATDEAADSGAMATVTARSLRVRAQPSQSAAVVAGIREGEQYAVIGRSSDGLWLELAIPQAAQGSGWVSANFVTVAGSITNAEVASAPTPAPTEATATEAAATATTVVEATAAPTEEATMTETPTEVAATPAATEAPTAAPAEETTAVTPPAAGFALVTAEGARLRVRAEASTEAAIVGWVQPGETVPVVEVSADGLWVKIGPMPGTQNPNGGWVSAEFLLLGQ
ncbi:MAG TPA: SH3 domain-containing protein [Chloroflexi bacterium]|nr:SH3 domain-containing protein [Chloroflexota bacterium]